MPMRIPEAPRQFEYVNPDNGGARLQPMRVTTSEAMFGATGAQALAQAGKDLRAFGARLQEDVERRDRAVAEEAFAQRQKEETAFRLEQNKRRGRNALGAADGSSLSVADASRQWASEARRRFTENMSPYQKRLFSSLADRADTQLYAWAGSKEQREDQVWRTSLWQGTAEEASNRAAAMYALGDMDAFRSSMAEVQHAVRQMGAMQGWDEKYTDQKALDTMGDALLPIGQTLIADGNLRGAQAFIKEHAPALGAKRVLSLQNAVKAEQRRQAAEARAAAAEVRAQQQLNFLAVFSKDPLHGLAEISTPEGRTKYGIDAKSAKELRGMLQTQWNFNKQVEKENNENYITTTVNGIYNILIGDPQKNIAPDPARAYQILQNSDLDAVTKIEMGRKLEDGTFGKTRDPSAVNDMAKKIVAGEISSDAPIDTMLALGQASREDAALLKTMRKDMEGPQKDLLKRADTLVDNAFSRPNFAPGTPEAALKEDRARNQFHKIIMEIYQKQGEEGVLKWFDSDGPMSILNSHAININDQLENLNRIMKSRKSSSGTGTGIDVSESTSEGTGVPLRMAGETIIEYQRRTKRRPEEVRP